MGGETTMVGSVEESPATRKEWRRLAQRVIDRQSKAMTSDALILARFVLSMDSHAELLENLTSAQKRSGELLETLRAVKQVVKEIKAAPTREGIERLSKLLERI